MLTLTTILTLLIIIYKFLSTILIRYIIVLLHSSYLYINDKLKQVLVVIKYQLFDLPYLGTLTFIINVV